MLKKLMLTTKMHKEIENMLNKEESFANVPKKFYDTIHEAHFCIHMAVRTKQCRTRRQVAMWHGEVENN